VSEQAQWEFADDDQPSSLLIQAYNSTESMSTGWTLEVRYRDGSQLYDVELSKGKGLHTVLDPAFGVPVFAGASCKKGPCKDRVRLNITRVWTVDSLLVGVKGEQREKDKIVLKKMVRPEFRMQPRCEAQKVPSVDGGKGGLFRAR
jgi:hypothetical protein